ncbi:MAG TPA: metallophosphoesterase family protein [Thermoanaerobaculia bacterium]|nr:metallophosphoesterase family protein [Thermoanaerobaculia bacterium]
MTLPLSTTRIAFIGGIYSNYQALQATLADIDRRGVDGTWFLGDLGAFGPHPDRVPELLIERKIPGIQGNYEQSLSSGATDCNCGYTDPRDNVYAQLSYDYTATHTSDALKRWMGGLPLTVRLELGDLRVLLSHGSPRRINEFLWRSSSPDPFLNKLCDDYETDVIVCTHTGLHWHRALGGKRHVVNAGVIGRPANDGGTNVWYTIVSVRGSELAVEFVPVIYDHQLLMREMSAEQLPTEFIETIATGWWTTCLEALPTKERSAGKF